MKKRVVFFITMIIICTSFLMFSNKIQATDKTLNSSIEVEKTEIKQGEETFIILKIDSDEQINAFKAKINYDSNIWEELDENSFETKKGWESLKYNKENNEFIVINKQEETNKEILKINLKAKNSANVGKTEITIDEIEKELHVSKEDIILAKEAARKVESIENATYTNVKDGNTISLIEKISTNKDEEEILTNKLVIKELINGLEKRDKEVIMLRFFKEKTQAQVAKILGVTQVQVSRIERKILNNMKLKLSS